MHASSDTDSEHVHCGVAMVRGLRLEYRRAGGGERQQAVFRRGRHGHHSALVWGRLQHPQYLQRIQVMYVAAVL